MILCILGGINHFETTQKTMQLYKCSVPSASGYIGNHAATSVFTELGHAVLVCRRNREHNGGGGFGNGQEEKAAAAAAMEVFLKGFH